MLQGVVRIFTSVLQPVVLQKALSKCDVAIGAMRAKEGRSPCIVSEDMVSRMKADSIIIDVSIDQGGCFEDSRPTTHAEPTFKVHETVFYCVANMPGAVPHTSTYALTNATLSKTTT